MNSGNIAFSFGSGLADSVFGKVQAPVRAIITRRAQAFETQSVLPYVYHFGKSRHFGESITSLTSMEGFSPVGEGGAYPVQGLRECYRKTIEHQVWKGSFLITREAADDSMLMDLRKKPEAFVTSYYMTRERFGAAMLAGGLGKKTTFEGRSFSTAGADGEPLFSTSHPALVKTSLRQSNCFAGAFSNKVLGQVATRMQNFEDDCGHPLTIAPDTIIIPNDETLKYAVFEAIGADKSPETAQNGFNYHYGLWNVIVWPYLNSYLLAGSDKPFILMDSTYNKLCDGAFWLERTLLEISSDRDENDNNRWKGYARFGVGFNDWRAFAVGGISSGTSLSS